MKDIAVRTAIKPARGRPRAARCRAWRWLAPLVAMISLGACGRDLPDPVTRKDGMATIPFDGRTYVIPEKSWLKGYYRRSTDGTVAGFTLHAVAPNVEPWTPERNHGMYGVPGWGNRIEVRVSSRDGYPPGKQTPASFERSIPDCKFSLSSRFPDQQTLECENTKTLETIVVLDNAIRYTMQCDSQQEVIRWLKQMPSQFYDPNCSMFIRHMPQFRVQIVFAQRYMNDAFRITRTVERLLESFENMTLNQTEGEQSK